MKLKRVEYLSLLIECYLNRCDGRYTQVQANYAIKGFVGEHILPLPEWTEYYYITGEAGKILGIFANKVVWIANLNHLQNDKYDKWFIDKAKHTNK